MKAERLKYDKQNINRKTSNLESFDISVENVMNVSYLNIRTSNAGTGSKTYDITKTITSEEEEELDHI